MSLLHTYNNAITVFVIDSVGIHSILSLFRRVSENTLYPVTFFKRRFMNLRVFRHNDSLKRRASAEAPAHDFQPVRQKCDLLQIRAVPENKRHNLGYSGRYDKFFK